ncbi:hypothetical protein LJC74_05560 [Eubacteriales bacterium OttesenSCG-928-A19]|nr:hypothetical protein [Eubacteriales bacterium OttesenSCG-928-A19]
MKRRLLALGLCMLLALPVGSFAADALAPGQHALEQEAAALAQVLELRTDTTFSWGGLPLLDGETDSAIKSLLSALTLRTRRQQGTGDGYAALDVMLQRASVLDLSMQALDGVYYEQSNLLGGQTVAFTPEEFRMFMARLSARSGGAMPTNMDLLFTIVMRALGAEPVEIDPATLDGALLTFAGWSSHALTTTERLRPRVFIPGLYGIRAEVVDVTRAELLTLAEAYSDLLSENEALWLGAASAQQPGADDATLSAQARQIAAMMRALPDLLAAALPEGIPPAEYREVFDADGALVVRQLELTLPDGEHVYVEWVPAETGVSSLYASLAIGESGLELLVTREDGAPVVTRRQASQRRRIIASMTYSEPDLTLDIVATRTEDVLTTDTRDNTNVRTEIMMESEALFGEGTVVTLSASTTGRATGQAGRDYSRREETVWRLKGLGFDSRKILTVSSRTTAVVASPPAAPGNDAVRPARMDDAALDDWLSGTRLSLLQVWYTVLGRLPPDVAAYVLERME